MADAAITAWDTKFHYVFWRPLTAIQEGDNDGNPETSGAPDWQPLINNPNYPDYTSGANNVTGAATRTLALFFGEDHMTFSVKTTNSAAVEQTRTYHRFSDAAADVVNARIYEGITSVSRMCRPGSRAGMSRSGPSPTFCGRPMTPIMMKTRTNRNNVE
jgi:hypothetical protein